MANRAPAISSASIRCRRHGHDHVAAAGQDQRRHIDPPEPIGDVERFQLGQPLGHDALVRLPDPLDHEIDQRPRLGLRSVEQVEELIDERIVARQGKPLEDAPRDRRADRSVKPRLRPVQDRGAQATRGCSAANSSAIAPPNETPSTAGADRPS